MGRVLHASYSGYFPVCMEENRNPADNFIFAGRTYGKISSSLENIMALYWRVKKWEFNFSGSVVFRQPGFDERTIFYDSQGYKPLLDLDNSFPEREEDLVCYRPFYFFGIGGEAVLDGLIYDLACAMFFAPKYSINPENNIITTYVYIDVGAPTLGFLSLAYPGQFPIQLGTFGINFLDKKISGNLSATSSLIVSGSAELSIRAKEYWAYEDAQGNALYNTETGQPL